MNLAILWKRAERLAADNSPGILTGIGVVGTVMTAYLTGTASFKAAELLREEQERAYQMYPGTTASKEDLALTPKEKVQLCWKLYLPAFGSGGLTIASIVTASRIGSRRAAAMAAAYSISEKAFSEYREKIVDKIGETKEQKYRDEIQQDRVRNNPPTGEQVVLAENEVLCFDKYTGRYFRSTMETIKAAQNAVNYEINHNTYASLNDFYNKLGLESVGMGEELGWTSDHLMEIVFSTVLADNGTPCLCMEFYVSPVRGYYKSWS